MATTYVRLPCSESSSEVAGRADQQDLDRHRERAVMVFVALAAAWTYELEQTA
jgi:hypothetical protein